MFVNDNKKNLKKDDFWSSVKVLFQALLIALVIRTFAYEPFNIPSGSMIPTLLVGDYLFVSKFSYGFSKHSFPFSLPIIPKGRILASEPKRGDVAVFRMPTESAHFIKRIVGLPGDRIQVIRGILHVNEKPVELVRVDDFETADDGTLKKVAQFRETLPRNDGSTIEHNILMYDPLGMGERDNTAVYTVPEGHYFMMGDNRQRSDDSRNLFRVGFISSEQLVGRAEILWASFEDASIWQIWKWPFAMRLKRFFNVIR